MIRCFAVLVVLLLAAPAAAQLPPPTSVDLEFVWERGEHDLVIAAGPDVEPAHVGKRLIREYVFIVRHGVAEVTRLILPRGDVAYKGAALIGITIPLPVAEGYSVVLHAVGQDGRLSPPSNEVPLTGGPIEEPGTPPAPTPNRINGFKKAGGA